MSDIVHARKEPHAKYTISTMCGAPNPNRRLVVTGVKSEVTCWRCIMLLLGRELPKAPELPEHDKLKAAKGPRGDDTQLVGEFLTWLDEQGIHLAKYDRFDELQDIRESTQSLLEQFFEIDGDKLSAEKDLLLDYLRKENAAREWAENDGRDALQRA